MTRKLVVDGQIFQTPAWHRGMGKYSLALISQLNQLDPKAEEVSIDLILSKQLSADPSLVSELQHKITDVNLVWLDLLANETDSNKVTRHNRQVVDSYLESAYPSVGIDFLILSLMQREIYPVFPSSQQAKRILLFYDLIPLMFHEIYLDSPITQHDYLTKFAELLKADRYLSISKTAANDLTQYLGINKNRIVNIDGGPITHGSANDVVDVPKPFILMPTGNDLRKNNQRGVQAFHEFNQKHNHAYTLVITSFFEPKDIKQLQALSDNLVFTGNVSGEQLDYLYQKAEALLFPSEYEGLGLPILEAVLKNKPVACSDISVFREMSNNAFYYFDPYSVPSITRALIDAVQGKDINQQEYDRIRDAYTWQKTAHKAIQAIAGATTDQIIRPKVAFFGPELSKDSFEAKSLLKSHASLSRKFELDYYLDPNKDAVSPRVNFLPHITSVASVKPGLGFHPAQYAASFYFVGNAPEYATTLFGALGAPGALMLYSLDLEETWLSMVKDGLITENRFSVEKRLQEDCGGEETKYIVSLVSSQRAIIVFSQQAAKAVSKVLKKINSSAEVCVLYFPASPLAYPEILPTKQPIQASLGKNSLVIDGNTRIVTTDLQFNEQIAKLRTLKFSQTNQLAGAVEVMSLGVVPLLPEENQLRDMLVGNKSALEASVKHVEAYMEEHNQESYARELFGIVERIQ